MLVSAYVKRCRLRIGWKTVEGAIGIIFSKRSLKEDARDNRRVLAVLVCLDGGTTLVSPNGWSRREATSRAAEARNGPWMNPLGSCCAPLPVALFGDRPPRRDMVLDTIDR